MGPILAGIVNFLKKNGITLLAASIPFIDEFLDRQQESIDKANQLTQAFKDQQNEITKNIATVQNLENEFNTLAKGVDDYGNNISLSTAGYQRYQQILQEILSITPQLIVGYDSENNAIANKNDLIQQSIQLLKEQRNEEYADATSAKNTKAVAKGAAASYDQQLDQVRKQAMTFGVNAGLNPQDLNPQGLLTRMQHTADGDIRLNQGSYSSLLQMAQNIEEVIERQQALGNMSDEHAQKIRDNAKEYINEYNKLNNETAKIYNNHIQLIVQTADSYHDLTDAQKNFVTQYIDNLDTMDKSPNELIKISNETKAFVNSLNKNSQAKKAINQLFSLDSAEVNAKEYAQQATDLINQIVSSLDEKSSETARISLESLFDMDLSKIMETLTKNQPNLSREAAETLAESLSKEDLDLLINADFVFVPESTNMDEMVSEAQAFTDALQQGLFTSEGFKLFEDNANRATEAFDQLVSSLQEGATIEDPLSHMEIPLQSFLENATSDQLESYVGEQFSSVSRELQDDIARIIDQYRQGNIDLDEAKNRLQLSIRKPLSAALEASDTAAQLSNQLDDLQRAYNTAAKAIDELNTSGHYSIDTLQELLKISPEYLNLLMDEEGNLTLTKDALYDLAHARMTEMVRRQFAELVDTVTHLKDEAAAARFLSTELCIAADAWDDYYDATIQNAEGPISHLGAMANPIFAFLQDMATNYKKMEEYGEKALLENGLGNKPSSSKSSSRSSSGASKDLHKESFDSEYKELQHHLKMEIISRQKYYDDLSALDAKYYANNKNYIDEHRKNTEELFDLKRRLDQDASKAQEHEIFLLSKRENTEQQQIAIYKQIQSQLHSLAQEARAQGLLETSEYIRELQTQWWVMEDHIASAQEQIINRMAEAASNASSAIDQVQNLYDSLKRAAAEFESSGYFSVDLFQEITSLGIEYLALLTEENGQLAINEESIHKIIAARTEQLAIEQALNYVKAVGQTLASGNEEELNRLLYATDATASSTWDLVYANYALLKSFMTDEQFEAGLHVINAYRDAAQAATKSVGQVVDDTLSNQVKGLEDLLKYVMDMVQHEVKQHISYLRQQITDYKKIVDLQKESLRIAREKDNYEKTVAKKVEEIARKQSKLAQLQRDDSLKSKAQQAKLAEEINALNEELADYQADYAYQQTLESLDKMAQAFEKEKEEEIKEAENSISSQEKLYQLAMDRINQYWGDSWEDLYSDLRDWNTEYGNSLNDEITATWQLALDAAKEYGSYLDALTAKKEKLNTAGSDSAKVISDVNNYDTSGGDVKAKHDEIISKMKENSLSYMAASKSEQTGTQSSYHKENDALSKELESLMKSSVIYDNGTWYENDRVLYSLSNSEIKNAIVKQMYANSQEWFTKDPAQRTALESYQQELANRLISMGENVVKGTDGVWYIGKVGGQPLYEHVFHQGGIVGGGNRIKDGEVLALLEKGELVLDQKKKDSAYELIDMSSYMLEKFGTAMGNFTGAFPGMAQMETLVSTVERPAAASHSLGESSFNPSVHIEINNPGDLSRSTLDRIKTDISDHVMDNLVSFQKRENQSFLKQ